MSCAIDWQFTPSTLELQGFADSPNRPNDCIGENMTLEKPVYVPGISGYFATLPVPIAVSFRRIYRLTSIAGARSAIRRPDFTGQHLGAL